MWGTASPEIKQLLTDSFGEVFFKQDVMERVIDLASACRETGRDIDTVFDGCADEYKKAEKAIEVFAEAMREGEPENECFYYPYFYRSSGGWFSYFVCAFGRAYSSVGARLRVDDAKKAIHMGKCMLSYYKIYHG